jgi:CMD domain protein
MANPPEAATPDLTADATDVISKLAGISAGSPLAQVRAQRPDVARYAEGSYRALLEPDDPAGVSRLERDIIALRVAILTPSRTVADWHRIRLRQLGTSDATIAAIEHFPEGEGLSPRQVAILRHTDLLTTAPGDATPEHIAALKAVGLGPRDIVTIAQLISFESFQVRVLAALRLLGEGK